MAKEQNPEYRSRCHFRCDRHPSKPSTTDSASSTSEADSESLKSRFERSTFSEKRRRERFGYSETLSGKCPEPRQTLRLNHPTCGTQRDKSTSCTCAQARHGGILVGLQTADECRILAINQGSYASFEIVIGYFPAHNLPVLYMDTSPGDLFHKSQACRQNFLDLCLRRSFTIYPQERLCP